MTKFNQTIISVLVILVIRFLWKSWLKRDIQRRYGVLIRHIEEKQDCRQVLEKTKNSITLGKQIPQGWTKFYIKCMSDRLVIEWRNKDIFAGELFSKWQYKFTTNQDQIIDDINLDISKMYQKLKNENG